MTLSFEPNAYLASMRKEESFRFEEDIFYLAKQSAQFTFGNVDYVQFSESYGDNEVTIGQRVTAIPLALWEIVKSIYALAKLLFLGMWNVATGPCENWDQVKILSFECARSVQKVAGNFIFPFHSQYGEYLLEEADFQLSCYDCFNTSLDFASNPLMGELRYRMDQESNLSLLEYKRLSYSNQSRVIEEFRLIEEYGSPSAKETSLHTFVNETDDELLEFLSLADLPVKPNPMIQIAFMDQHEFSLLTFKQFVAIVQKPYFKDEEDRRAFFINRVLPYIAKRVEVEQHSPLLEETINEDSPLGAILSFLKNTDPEKVTEMVPQLDPDLFVFLDDRQIKGTHLEKLTKEQSLTLFSKQGRVQLFDVRDIAQTAHQGKLPLPTFEEFTEAHLLHLDLMKLSPVEFRTIFHRPYEEGKRAETRYQSFLQQLPTNQAFALLFQGQFGKFPSLQGLFSEKQLSEFQISQLSSQGIHALAYGISKDEFAFLDPSEVAKALDAGLFGSRYDELFDKISENQWKAIKISKKPENDAPVHGYTMFSLDSYFFHPNGKIKIITSERKAIFANLDPEDIVEAWKQGVIRERWRPLFSEAQNAAITQLPPQ